MVWHALLCVFLMGGRLSQGREGNLQAGRQLFHWSTQRRTIWGHCDHLDREITGCHVQGSCSDYLSPGPEDADVEVTLAGLPASTASNPVHLHWWAARRSPSAWNPLESPKGAAVYRSMTDAYPKFFEPAFNGGNVLVDNNGQATIRVRAPAAYMVPPYLAIPNIKLRLCQNTTFMQHVADKFVFGMKEQWLETGPKTRGMKILHMKKYSPRPGTPRPNASQPLSALNWKKLQPIPHGYIYNCKRRKSTEIIPDPVTTAMVTTTTVAATASTGAIATTMAITPAATTTMVKQPPIQGLDALDLEAARDALDLDALEFSPVYICLSRGQVFDHFTDDCANSCSEGTVAKHGQCVRPLTKKGTVLLSADWQLQLVCSPTCTLDKTNMTLHGLRLSIAGHLDVPFQEIEDVVYGYEKLGARRLASTTNRVLHLRVMVRTGRLLKTDGTVLLTTWLSGEDHASELLGLQVKGVSNTGTGTGSGFTQEGNIGAKNDPYAPAYEKIEDIVDSSNATFSTHGTVVNEDTGLGIPGVIGGIAGSIVFIGIVAGAGLFFHRRRMRLKAAREAQNNKLGGKTNSDVSPELPKEEQLKVQTI
mmetsp:Transcript_130253/g.259804  ORF Transcript_130253/g.259804 Transcript_130253/m.259804 type:complete len:591 (+) Transcript_130253:76-1848(+)